MRKRLLKTMTVILLISLLWGLNVYAGEESSTPFLEEKKQVLLEKGMECDEIDKFHPNIICHIYDVVVSEHVDHIEVLKESHILDIKREEENRAIIPTTKLKVNSYTINYADETGMITGCDVNIRYEWLESPITKQTDVLTLNWDPELFKFSGYMSGYNAVKNSTDGMEDFYNFMEEASLTSTSGIGWYTELVSPNIPVDIQTGQTGEFYISLEPSNEFYAQDNIVSFFKFNYYHNIGTEIILEEINGEITATAIDNNMDTYSRRIAYASKVIND